MEVPWSLGESSGEDHTRHAGHVGQPCGPTGFEGNRPMLNRMSDDLLPVDRPLRESSVPLVKSARQVDMPAHGVVIEECRHAMGFFANLNDDYAKFHLVVAGRACWEAEGHQHHIGPGTMFFVAAHTPHRQQDVADAPVTLYFIHFKPALLPTNVYRTLSSLPMRSLDLTTSSEQVSQRVRAIFQEMLFEQDAKRLGWETLLQARLLDLTVLCLRQTEVAVTASIPISLARGDSAFRVAAYAQRQESTFYFHESIDEAAHAVQLSRRRFTELFRTVTGETWIQRLQRLRLEHARRLLIMTDRSITAVAFECGFEDLSHFHHSFKRTYACTPRMFRERHCPIRQS